MRVISQDGTLDFPYELSTIRVYNEIISMGMCKDDSCRSIIARYSTEEKAIKAMKMLKEHYSLLSFMKLIAGTAKYESLIKSFTEDDFIKAVTEYFQFPQDDGIEV